MKNITPINIYWDNSTLFKNERKFMFIGITVQFFPENTGNPGDVHNKNSQIDFQGLINQLNKSHESRVLQESPDTNFVKSSSTYSSNECARVENQLPPNSTPKVHRTGSVIKFLPKPNLVSILIFLII